MTENRADGACGCQRRRSLRTLCVAALAAILSLNVWSREATLVAEDPALEARVQEIAQGLRCLVCQNETIAASTAGLAVDLREQIRQRLRAGQSPSEIRQFMVDRFGRFILYKPSFEPGTWALWAGPFVLFAAALSVFGRALRRRAVGAALAEGQMPADEGDTRPPTPSPGNGERDAI